MRPCLWAETASFASPGGLQRMSPELLPQPLEKLMLLAPYTRLDHTCYP